MAKHDHFSLHGLDETTALRTIFEGTATETGERFFTSLVENLARALNTHGAWVTEYIQDCRRLRALAFWLGGEWIRDYEYDIAGTPCEAVIEGSRLIHYPENVISLYPEDRDLKETGAVSFMGVPLVDVDGKILGVYGTGGRGTTGFVIRPGNTVKGTIPKLVRSLKGRLPYVPTPLVQDNLLFIWNDNGTVICYRLPDYEQLWEAKVPGNFYGSPVCVNDRLYCISKKGVVVVIAAAETYQLLAENPLGELSYTTPAISGGRMYLRTHTQLISVGGREEEKTP